jgi:hypothetical protein
MRHVALLIVVVGIAALQAGCASTAPRYDASYSAVQDLKRAEVSRVTVNDFVADPRSAKAIESLTIRGGKYSSPAGTFAKYVSDALRQELESARTADSRSTIVIDGVLLQNELNAAGFSTGYAVLELALTVKSGGRPVYEGKKSARHEWPSNFVGAIAIPRAIENYPVVVRKVLAEFYADPVFIQSIAIAP